MLSPRFQGLKIIVSDSAMRELFKLGKDMHDVLEVLESGYDAPRKRKAGTIERWLDKGKKTVNAIIALDYNETMQEECWVLVHFGKFARNKK
ncbi:MAG TPA: hypothetical protein HA362_08145 [Nanoarchaeota archaeon]|nr:hypothetical protein [Nanoarchaeota archaeon]